MRNHTTLKRSQAGLSIVEIMIALALGSLLTLGLVQIFTANSQSFRMNEANGRAQESGRIAADILSRAIRNAGYFGCYPAEGFTNNLDTSDKDYNEALHTYRSEGITAEADLRPDAALDGTDFFQVSGVHSSGGNISAEGEINSATIEVTDTGDLEPGDVVMVSDCTRADIFEISNVNEKSFKIVANSGSGSDGMPGNDFSGNSPPGCNNPSTCLSAVYKTGAQINLAYNETYFINNDVSSPALFIRDTEGRVYELVSGVVDMRIRFGEGDPQTGVQQWRATDDISDWGRVLATEVSLLVRAGDDRLQENPQSLCFPGWLDCGNADDLTAMPDNRLYRVYTFTTSIRNRI